jgi:hypothetical protein
MVAREMLIRLITSRNRKSRSWPLSNGAGVLVGAAAAGETCAGLSAVVREIAERWACEDCRAARERAMGSSPALMSDDAGGSASGPSANQLGSGCV